MINYLAGTVIDMLSILLLIDENNFTYLTFPGEIVVDVRRADNLQSALCHVNTRTTCSVSMPAPLSSDACPRKDCVLSCKAPTRPLATSRETALAVVY